jgi:hypothetical protein
MMNVPPQMPATALPFLPVDQEARLVALLRGIPVPGGSDDLMAAAVAGGVPGPIAYLLRDSRALAVQEMRHRHALHWLRRAGVALDHAGVPFAVLKGAPLSERYYRPGFLRSCGDLDLLIDPGDFSPAQQAILAIGYHPSSSVPNLTTRILGHDATFVHPAGPAIELHVRLHSHFGIRPAAGPILARTVRQSLSNGYSVRVPEPVDEFVHLAAHAVSHRWREPRWLHDLFLLLDRCRDLDWQAVAERTTELRLWPSVLLTCAVLESEWATRVPLADLAARRYRRAQALLPAVRRSTWAGSGMEKSIYLLRETRLCDGPAEKLRHLARGFTYPVLRRLREVLSTCD